MRDKEYIQFEPFLCGEDERWLIQVLQNVSKVCLINQVAYFWKVRSESITYDRQLFDRRLDIYRVKRANCELLREGDAAVYQVAVVNQYINMYTTLIDAYSHKNREACALLKKHFKDYRRVYLTSDEKLVSKCKKTLVEMMIRLHMPVATIRVLDGVGGQSKAGNKTINDCG